MKNENIDSSKNITYWIHEINRKPGGFMCWEVVDEEAEGGPRIVSAGRVAYVHEIHSHLNTEDELSRDELFNIIRDKCDWVWSKSLDEHLPESSSSVFNLS